MVCVHVHMGLGIPNGAPLGFAILGTSLMGYLHMHLNLFGFHGSWNIINWLFVYAFDLVCELIEYFVLLLTTCFILRRPKYNHQAEVVN